LKSFVLKSHGKFFLYLVIFLFAVNIAPVFSLEIIPINVGANPWAISINPTTNKIYVTNSGNDTVSVIDGKTNTVKFLTVGQNPTGIVVNPFTNLAYVSKFSSNSISVINGTTDTVIADIPVGKLPDLLGLDAVSNKIYVPNSAEKSVSIIDGNTNTVLKTILLENNPAAIIVNPQTHLAYVTNAGNVTVIDGNTDQISKIISVSSGHLTSMAVNPSTNRIYVSDILDTHIFVIDSNDDTVITKIQVGKNPDGIAINPNTNRIYVANSGDGSVSVIDGNTNTVTDNIPAGTHVFAIAVNPISGVIYTANDSPGILYAISDAGKSNQNNITCEGGTLDDKGVCVLDKESKSSGCLIATASYGTELAPQVQLLREIRDSSLYQTRSGTTFMAGFNEFYYSFSPTISDWERQSPLFKETMKLAITPMLSTLSILNYAEIHSEQQMIGYGIGIILLNAGIYFGIPTFAIVAIRKRF